MRDVSICDAMNASCHNTTDRGDQTSKNHNCQNIERVFTVVPVHIQHVFSGVPTISNRGSTWVNGVPATQKTLQISVVNREIQIFEVWSPPWVVCHDVWRYLWLRLVGSLKLQVSFAECCLFYWALLQKRPIIWSLISSVSGTSRCMTIPLATYGVAKISSLPEATNHSLFCKRAL